MMDSKLYQTLKTFDIYELNRLKKFIDSPYYNVNDRISHLFDLIYQHLKEETHGELDKELMFGKIFDEPYHDRKFRKLASDLLKLVESFLSTEEFEKQALQQTNYLLKAVHEKKIEKLYNTTVKTAQRLSERQPDRSANYFLQKYQIEKNFYELTQAELKRAERSNIDAIIENLDYFYLSEKLKYYCTLLSRRKIQKHEYNILFIEEILEHIEKQDYGHHPQISVFFNVYKLYENVDNVDNYYQLKEFIQHHEDLFSIDDLRDIYLAAINFCIGNANQGKQTFIRELFEIYKLALRDKVLLVDNELSPWSFKNIVLTGLRVGEDQWIEDFIEKYSSYLNEEYRENALMFNRARLLYYRKEYKKVIPLLNQVEFTDFSYNLDSKALLLATYYELNEIEVLYSFLDAFKAYLGRHKKSLPEARRKNYSNLIKFTRKLLNIYPGDQKLIDQLKNEIKENSQIADIRWLKEKIKELEGRSV